MKQTFARRAAGLLLALALCAGPLTLPVLADETAGSTPPASTAASQSTGALNENGSAEGGSGSQNGENQNNENGDGTGGGSQGGGQGSATAINASVVAATVTTPDGNEVVAVKKGDVVNVVLKMADYTAAQLQVTEADISARVNTTAFTYVGNAEVSQLVSSEDANGAYYSYVLLFRNVVYNGGSQAFDINLSYLNSTMEMQKFTVTLGQCVTEKEAAPAEDARAPSLIVRGSSYGTETITAGSAFTLSLTLYATDGTEAVNDVVASLTLPEGVTMTGGNLSQYVGTMQPRSSRDISFSIQSGAGFTGGVANITVNLVGAGAVSGSAVSGSTSISVPISQPDRFEVGQLQLTDSIYLGDTATVTLNFVNKGRNPVANLEASITGENLGAELTQQYIGNVAAGTENSVDFDLYPTQTGTVNGSIVLTYEAEDGSVKTVSKDFSLTVMEMPVYDDPGMMDPGMVEPEQPAGFPVFGIVLIVVLVVVVAVVIVVIVRRKRKKAAALARLEGDEDEDL